MSCPEPRRARRALCITLLFVLAGATDWVAQAVAQSGGVIIEDIRRVKPHGGGTGSIPPASPTKSPPQP